MGYGETSFFIGRREHFNTWCLMNETRDQNHAVVTDPIPSSQTTIHLPKLTFSILPAFTHGQNKRSTSVDQRGRRRDRNKGKREVRSKSLFPQSTHSPKEQQFAQRRIELPVCRGL